MLKPERIEELRRAHLIECDSDDGPAIRLDAVAFANAIARECATPPTEAPAASAGLSDSTIPEDCDVRKILLRVVPGDGDGCEVYARNVRDVDELLSELGERLEDFESRSSSSGQLSDDIAALSRLAAVLESGHAFNGIADDNARIYAEALGRILAARSSSPGEETAECKRCGCDWSVCPCGTSPTEVLTPQQSSPVCATCNGRGEVGGHVGQTPENFDYVSEPCPDCTPSSPVEAGAEPAAEVESWTNGSYHRNYKLRWLKDVEAGTKLYTAPPAQSGEPRLTDEQHEAIEWVSRKFPWHEHGSSGARRQATLRALLATASDKE